MHEAIKRYFVRIACEHESWQSFWGCLLNTAKGNVPSIVEGFVIAGVDTTNIERAYLELRAMQFPN